VDHINFWDYTKGKKGSGREISGHEPVEYRAGCADTDAVCPRRNPMLPGFLVTPAPVFTLPSVPGIVPTPILTPVLVP
jgi:hypothetical protein